MAKFQTRRLGTTIRPQQVVIAPGSKPLLFALFDILDGDVLLPRPSWVSYEPQVMHAGKRLFWVETDQDDRHTLTGLRPHAPLIPFKSLIDSSEESLHSTFSKAVAEGGNPRVMLINSPSNPTGQAFTEATLETIKKFCVDRDIVLISDEIYSDIWFNKENDTSACAGSRFNTGFSIMTGGLSKVRSH